MKWAYPLLLVSLWGAVGALFLVVLRVPRRSAVRLGVSVATGCFALLAILVMQRDAPVGLAALQGLRLSFRELGTGFAWAGVVCVFLSAGLQVKAHDA